MWPNYRSGVAQPPPPPQPGGEGGWTPALSTNTQNQWASYYQSMAPQQVDWASLAQQWISMKSDGPPGAEGSYPEMQHQAPPQPPLPPSMPAHHQVPYYAPQAPPPPNMSEGGEANMDLEENGGDMDYNYDYSSHPSFPDVYHSRAPPPPRQNHDDYHHQSHHHQPPQQHHQHHHHQSGGYHSGGGNHHHGGRHPQQAGGWGGDGGGWGNNRPPPIQPLMDTPTPPDFSNLAFR